MSHNLTFSTDNAELNIRGSTFCIKETLKCVGAKWNPKTTSWNLPISLDTPTFRANLNSLIANKKIKGDNLKRTTHFRANTNEDNVKRAIDLKNSTNGAMYQWICCESATVISWDRMTTCCDVHASDNGFFKNTLRVRGRTYTGD